MPMTTEAQIGTYPAAGVIVARPATAPVSRPTKCGFFAYHHSTNSHVVAAKDAAMSVFKKAVAVMSSTLTSLPALNPYQPNQSRPVPSAMNGMLCAESTNLRLPTYSTDASAAQPALAWTTMPPAKSRAPQCASRPPPQNMCTNG